MDINRIFGRFPVKQGIPRPKPVSVSKGCGCKQSEEVIEEVKQSKKRRKKYV